MKKKTHEKIPLKAIYLEDSPRDVEMISELLTDAGYDLRMDYTATENEFASYLRIQTYDIILSDFNVTGFDAFQALRLSKEICPEVPFICISGAIGEETAVEVIKQGAVDYVLKDRMVRLPSAIKRALDEVKEKRARRQAEEALNESVQRFRRLFEASPDAIMLLDPFDPSVDWPIIDCNDFACQMNGYTRGEMIGKSIDILNISKGTPEERVQYLKEIKRKGVLHLESFHRHKDAHIFPIEVSTSIITFKGRELILGIDRDITERKRAEEALRTLSVRQDAILSAVPVIIMEVNTDKVYTWANKSGMEFFGDDVIGKEAALYFEGEQSTYDIVRPIFTGSENVVYVESWQKRKDGEKRLLAWWCRVLKDANGQVTGALSSARDITELKKAEEELRLFSHAIKSSNECISITDTDNNILFVNQAFLDTYGYTENELLGKSIYLVRVHSQFNNDEILTKTIHSGWHGELLNCKKDGSIFPVSLSTSVVYDENKQPIALVGIAVDITKRKQTEKLLRENEERFRSLFENSTVGIYRTTPDGRILLANPTLIKILDYPSFEELEKRGIREDNFVQPYDRSQFLEKIERDGEIKDLESCWTQRDGTKVFLRESARAIRDSQGRTLYYDGIVENITERKLAEEALRESEAMLSEAMQIAKLGTWEYDVLQDQFKFNDQFFTLYHTTAEREGGYIMSSAHYAEKFVHPDDMALVGVEIQKALETDDPNYHTQLDHRIIRADGEMGYITVHIRIEKDAQGRTVKTHGVNQDITERKKTDEALKLSEEKYRRIFENVQIVIYQTDLEGRVIDISPSIQRNSGYTREEVIGKPVASFYANPADRQALLNTMREKGEVVDYITVLRTKNGQLIYVSLNAQLIKDTRGNPCGVEGTMRDITESRLAEEDLRRVTEGTHAILWRAKVTKLEDGTGGCAGYSWDTHYLNLDTVNTFMPLQSHPSNDLSQMFHFSILAEDRKAMEQRSSDALNIGSNGYTQEFRLRDINGIVHSMYEDARIKRINDTRFELIGFITDITERKLAEEALKKNEERLKELFENAPVGYHVLDAQGNISAVNQTELKMLGFSYEEMIGWPSWEFISDREEARTRVLDKLAGKLPPDKNSERIFVRRDGSTFPVIIDDVILRNDLGHITGIRTTLVDITERKHMEEALTHERNLLRALMDNVPDQIYFKDISSRFIRISKALANKFGISGPAEATGKTDFDFFTEQHAHPAYESEQEIIKTGRPLVNFEEKETWPDGRVTWVSTTKVPLYDLEGQIIGTFGISRDITEQKKLQSELLQTQKVQSIGTLAGGIAHDFNNLLGIILAYTSVLERVRITAPGKFAESIKAINSAVSRGAALVRQILTFAHQTDMTIRPMSVPELAHEVVMMLQETFPKIIEFKEEIDRGIPLITADHTQIHQAVLNLCVNARDAMPKGGLITMRVETCTLEKIVQQFPGATYDRYVCLSVSDTGTGMNEEAKDRIFDPFFTTKELGKGTGLGLSVVYGVVQSHYGFISVDSEVGKGTTFHLYLPVTQEFKKINEEQKKESVEPGGGTETILFVEDEELLRTAVQSTLESSGYKVYVAVDGREAVEVYRQHQNEITLIVTDMGLPKQTGMEVFRQVKKINPGIKIILASGFISLDQKSELLKAGASEFIQKPYLLSEVLQKIREVLDEK